MQGETVERELLTAAKAVEKQLITAEDLAKAVAHWAQTGKGSLLPHLEDLPTLKDIDRQQLRSLFAEFHETLVGQIAESLDDSLFGKLNGALANVGDADLKASITKWQGIVEHRSRETVSETDRFEIISAHAQGGLGEVLLAEDRQLNREVALKRIREKWSDNEHARIRFQLEAEITGRLEHPGVVPVYALGTRADGEVYYAMRFIRGKSLEDTLNEFHQSIAQHPDGFQSSDFRNLIRRFVDVCNTISYAHSRGIIHRDLKPANIMLGKYGETLVVDWGLAKQVGVEEETPNPAAESLILSDSGSGSAPTQFGSAVGTPQYMSPEQATGRLDHMGPSTDVFGLGATLYHVLTNTPPQQEDSVERVLDRVEHGDYRLPSTVNASVPKPLEAICCKALSVRPSERYATPTKLAEDIERWLADEPIAVHSDPIQVRAARWVRKNQTLAATTAVAMVLLIVASFLGSFAWTQFEHQQFEFEQAEQRRKATAHEQAEVKRTRLQSSLETTNAIVQAQIDDGHFDTAISVLQREINVLISEPEFASERFDLQAQHDRLTRIAEFYKLAADAQEANFLAQDESEIIATAKGLDLVGVWQRADWWNNLPDDDLNAEQRDQLREAVYRDLVLLASTYTKLTGTRTLEGVGGKIPDTLMGKFDAIFTADGKDEARATLAICSLANRYRYAECLEWYHGIAGFRLLKAVMVRSSKLDPPRNSIDAYEIGVLLLTKAIVGDFPFSAYLGVEDDFRNARELFGLASQMAPNHYFTNLVLAQTEYMLGERAAENGDPEAWRHYEISQQAFGRCIALEPDLPFAYGDVSTVCLREKEVIATSKTLSADDITRNQTELLNRCSRYARQAVERAPESAWVYWHYGHALAATNKIDEAMEAYRRAVTMSYRFAEDRNVNIIDVDRIRGRARLIEETQKRIDAGDNRSVFNAVIAAAYLMTKDFDKARPFVEAARAVEQVDSLAWATHGVLAMHDGDFDTAMNSFKETESLSADSFWAVIGQALCIEKKNGVHEALKLFKRAEELARTDYHRADAHLGQCRMLLHIGRGQEAAEALRAARESYPACHVNEVAALAAETKDLFVQSALSELRNISTKDIVNNSQIADTSAVFVHAGDFELPLERAWRNPGAASWKVSGNGTSTAEVAATEESTVPGSVTPKNHALHIVSKAVDDTFRAETRQTITVDHDTTFKLSCRVKSNSADDGVLKFFVLDEKKPVEEPVLRIPSGESSWETYSGTFTSPRLRRNKGLMPMTLRLQCEASGDIWIDDITIERVDEIEEAEASGGKE